MGLDMILYRVSKPENVSDGEKIDQRARSEKFKDVQFLEPEDVLSNTVKNHAVKCFCEKTSFDNKLAIVDMFVRLGLDEAKVSELAGTFRKKFSRSVNGAVETEFKTEDKKAMKFLKQSGVGKRGNVVTVELERTATHLIVCVAAENDSISVKCTRLGEDEYYAGRYNKSEWTEHYAFVLTDLAYQRDDLNEEGWELLPENASLCDDKELVRQLVEKGGLSPEFIEKWEDGVTVFYSWW